MAQHNLTGNKGEGLAAKYLSENGYIILHQNWRHSHWEVDIIAEKDGILHFIEVKTRLTKKFGHPEDGVDNKKIQNLINAAEEFLYLQPQWIRIQFNILSITILKDEPVEYFLIEDVYL
ncbi:MAG: YraN family protein [Ferruginibacter sp.]